MDDANHEDNAPRRRSQRNQPHFEVSGGDTRPVTRSKTASQTMAPETLSSGYPQDQDIRKRLFKQMDRTDLSDPETTSEIGQQSSDRLKNEARKLPGDPNVDTVQTLRSRHNMPDLQAKTTFAENRRTVNGSSSEGPDVSNDAVPGFNMSNLARQPIKRKATACSYQKESTSTRTSTRNTKCTESSSKGKQKSYGFNWSVKGLILLLICAAVLIMSAIWCSTGGEIHFSRAVKLEQFRDRFTILESSFPHQRHQLWHRTKIHLEKHLKTKEPTEPVSLIFTAGHSAEKTLHCLAVGVASSFSSAFNASVLSIDGASRAGYDSDEVKLDIDNQLQAAFEGEKPAVVIHRLEELPPSSTLIFYRYCDHESAAYKKVFLLFTVLVPQDEIVNDQSLKEVEEMVQDHLLEKLVDSNHAGFNRMDANKFSGLWSRISHLTLPVVTEEHVEKTGCAF